ncbi:MAG: AAA family ATPase [Fimbriimonadaceae bacterium]
MEAKSIASAANAIVQEIEKAIIGKSEVIEDAVLTMLCNGHLLIEDIPGVGKTTLAKALARTIGGEFRRVQFTPDLLPADITGASVYSQKTEQFEFRPGPVFANVVLVDEVNRATPKTQSSLLEAMEERQVSSDGITRPLQRPFFVIATQNNVEMTGTYPLPEAQLDRFFAKISLGYPDKEAEADILKTQQADHPIENVGRVLSTEELVRLQNEVLRVHVHESIREYIVDIVRATRESSLLTIGSSPRGSLFLMTASQAQAAINHSDFVRPDDVKAVAPLALGHRVMVRGEVRARGTDGAEVIRQVLESVPTPVPVS